MAQADRDDRAPENAWLDEIDIILEMRSRVDWFLCSTPLIELPDSVKRRLDSYWDNLT